MLSYETLKKNIRKFVSVTSLTPEEFEYVLPAFEQAYRQIFPDTKTKTGQTRERIALECLHDMGPTLYQRGFSFVNC